MLLWLFVILVSELSDVLLIFKSNAEISIYSFQLWSNVKSPLVKQKLHIGSKIITLSGAKHVSNLCCGCSQVNLTILCGIISAVGRCCPLFQKDNRSHLGE